LSKLPGCAAHRTAAALHPDIVFALLHGFHHS
jgi:hypothetical protein